MDNMGFLTRQQIIDAQDVETEVVPVPEWGGKVMVKGLTGVERDKFDQSLIKGRGRKRDVELQGARAKLVARTVVDPETLEPLFTTADVEALGKKSAVALQRVVDVAQKLSGIGDKALGDAAENLD